MCVCINICCVCVYMCIYVHVCMSHMLCVCYINIYMCISVYYVCIYVYVYTCVCVSICAYACTWSFLSWLSLGFSEQFFLDPLLSCMHTGSPCSQHLCVLNRSLQQFQLLLSMPSNPSLQSQGSKEKEGSGPGLAIVNCVTSGLFPSLSLSLLTCKREDGTCPLMGTLR